MVRGRAWMAQSIALAGRLLRGGAGALDFLGSGRDRPGRGLLFRAARRAAGMDRRCRGVASGAAVGAAAPPGRRAAGLPCPAYSHARFCRGAGADVPGGGPHPGAGGRPGPGHRPGQSASTSWRRAVVSCLTDLSIPRIDPAATPDASGCACAMPLELPLPGERVRIMAVLIAAAGTSHARRFRFRPLRFLRRDRRRRLRGRQGGTGGGQAGRFLDRRHGGGGTVAGIHGGSDRRHRRRSGRRCHRRLPDRPADRHSRPCDGRFPRVGALPICCRSPASMSVWWRHWCSSPSGRCWR